MDTWKLEIAQRQEYTSFCALVFAWSDADVNPVGPGWLCGHKAPTTGVHSCTWCGKFNIKACGIGTSLCTGWSNGCGTQKFG